MKFCNKLFAAGTVEISNDAAELWRGGRAALAGPPLERLRRAAFGQRPATGVRHSSSGRSKTSNLQNQPSMSPGPSGVRERRRAPPPNRQAASTAVWRGSTQMLGRENKQGVGLGGGKRCCAPPTPPNWMQSPALLST